MAEMPAEYLEQHARVMLQEIALMPPQKKIRHLLKVMGILALAVNKRET